LTQPESAVIVEPFPRVTWSAAKYEKVVRFSATDVLFYRVSGRDSLESRAMERIYTRIVEMDCFPQRPFAATGGIGVVTAVFRVAGLLALDGASPAGAGLRPCARDLAGLRSYARILA